MTIPPVLPPAPPSSHPGNIRHTLTGSVMLHKVCALLTCFLICQRLERESADHFVLVELGTKPPQNSTGRKPMIPHAALGSQLRGPGEVLGVVEFRDIS